LEPERFFSHRYWRLYSEVENNVPAKYFGAKRATKPIRFQGGDLVNNGNNECAVQLTDQVHIHLPPNAFTPEASNFWVGAALGAGILLIAIASLANQ